MPFPRHCRRFLAAAAVLSAIDLPAQGSCRDQQYPSGRTNALEVTATQPVTQTLTCGRAGTLLRVDVDVRHHVSGVTAPLEVRILATDGNGVPTDQVLASAQVAPAEIPTGAAQLVPVRFALPTTVTANQVVGIELAVSATRAYAWAGDAPGSYAAGAVFLRRTSGPSSFDLGFRTLVGAPATTLPYGAGHAGTSGIPSLTVSPPPRLGTTTDLMLGNSFGAATPGLLVLGTARASIATAVGGTLLVQTSAQLALDVPAAGAVLRLPIPNLPILCGTTLNLQAALADPGASHGVAFTPGLELVFGG